MATLLEKKSMRRKIFCLLSKSTVQFVILSNLFERSIAELVKDVCQHMIITVIGLEIVLENSTDESFTFIFGPNRSVY